MATASVLTLTLAALLPGPVPDGYFPSAENPLGVPALSLARPFLGLVTLLCTAVPGLLAVMSLGFRFRAGDALIRRQLEWVALAVLAVAALFGASAFQHGAVGSVLVDLGTVVFSTGVMIAIVRDRLLDIDRVLSRSLLTLIMTGLYAAAVSVFGLVLRSFASGAAPLLATAVVAVALQPLRAALQRLVSRLFCTACATIRTLSWPAWDAASRRRRRQTVCCRKQRTQRPGR
jgi:hypothetical protein